MNDLGYIASGFVLTFAAVVGYLLSLRSRLNHAERVRVAQLATADRPSQ